MRHLYAPLLLAPLLAACPKMQKDALSDAAAAPQAAVDAAAPPACTADVAAFVVDKGARLDTGLTVTKLHDGRIALGYATGDGNAKAALVDGNGKAQLLDVDAKHLHDSEKKESPKTNRSVNRVTPLGMKGMHMRVGVDLVDKNPDGSRFVRCGPADEEPTVSFNALSHFDPVPDAGAFNPNKVDDARDEVRDCRTFSNGEMNWVLASELWEDPEGKSFETRWAIDTKPGKASIEDAVVDSHVITPDKGQKTPKPDHYSFEVPVSVHVAGAGYVVAARYQGGLVVAKRQASLEPAGKPVTFNLGAPVGMPSLVVKGTDVALLVTEQGKTDLFGSVFAAQATPQKPEKIALTDTNPPAEGDRTSTSAAPGPKGDYYVVFADGKFGKKRARMAVLGPNLAGKTSIVDLTQGDRNVAETRVAATPDGKAFVAYLEAAADGSYSVTGAIYSCKD
jgi:hypothetical protein